MSREEILEKLQEVALKKFNVKIEDIKVDKKGNLIFTAFYKTEIKEHKRMVILNKDKRATVLEVLKLWIEKCELLDSLENINGVKK